MVKLCSWSAFSDENEPYVELLPVEGRGTRLRFSSKVAAKLRSKHADEMVRRFADEVQPQPNSHYFLSTALGAYDYWGSNNNGDAFEESELTKESEDIGYRSFVKHGRVYQHHRNKDPNRAMGAIKLSSFNGRMHRVELIEELDNVKAAEYIRRWYEVGSLPTSMGCATDPQTPIWTTSGFKPIGEVQSGDKVWSGEGRVCEVDYAMRREYDGYAFTVKAVGVPDLTMTAEHPWRVVRRADVWTLTKSNGLPKRNPDVPEGLARYVRSDEICVGDYLVQPVPQGEVECDISRSLARLAGYYLAEGYGNLCNGGRQVYPWLIVHKDDQVVREIDSLVAELDPEATVTISPHPASEQALNIQVFSDRLGRRLVDLCGRTSSDKRVSPEMLLAPRWLQMEFLDAYLSGDGFEYSKAKYASSKSAGLAFEVMIMMARVGWLGNIQRLDHGPSTVVSIPTVEYQVRSGIRNRETTSRISNSPKILTSWAILTPVKSIERARYVGTVYNFSVLGDDSYVSGMVATHNCKIAFDVCSICGHRAKHAAEYCEHAKYAMRKTLADGRKVCVFNPNPRFFDHSHVNVPADKIAGVMEKVASVSFAGVDLPWQEMQKSGSMLSVVHAAAVFEQPPVIEKVAAEEPVEELSDLALAVIKVANDRAGEIPLDVLVKIASEHSIETAASSMVHLGIVPTPMEWQTLVLVSRGNEKLARELFEQQTCFFPTEVSAEDARGNEAFLSERHIERGAIEKLSSFIPERSLYPDFLAPRVAVACDLVKQGADAVAQPWEIRKESPGMAKTMLALAASYGIMRHLAGESVDIAKGLSEITGKHPAVAGAILSAGIAAGLVTVDRAVGAAAEKLASGPNGLHRPLSAIMSDEAFEKRSSAPPMGAGEWLRKTPKSVRDVVLPLGAFSTGFLGSSYFRAKQLSGQPTSPTQDVIADHPLGSAVGAVAGYATARRAIKALRKGK